MTGTVAESGREERGVSVAGMHDSDQFAFSAVVELHRSLYRIATNACLDFLAHNEQRIALITSVASEPREPTPPPHIPWLQPYPDALLDVAAPKATEADSAVEEEVRVTPSDEELEVLQRYIKATEDGDMNAIAAVLREDLRFSMPPEPGAYASRAHTRVGRSA